MSENYVPLSKVYTRNGEVVGDTIWPEGMQRVAMAVEYNGADFHAIHIFAADAGVGDDVGHG